MPFTVNKKSTKNIQNWPKSPIDIQKVLYYNREDFLKQEVCV